VALIYPAGLTRELQVSIGAGVLLINLVVYFVLWRRRSIGR
jgi:type II secretory pathway component PulM